MTNIVRFDDFVDPEIEVSDAGNLDSRYWTKEESDFLESLVGEYPIELLMGKLREYWQKNGMRTRTRGAIRVRIHNKKQSTRSQLDNYSQRQLGALLGIGRKRLSRILVEVKGLVKLSSCSAISRKQLKKLIMERPDLFAELDADALYFTIGGEKESPTFFNYCKQVSSLLYTRPNTPRRVRLLNTGEIFDSLSLASAASFCSRHSISRVLAKKVESSCGLRWEYVDRTQADKPKIDTISSATKVSL